MHKIYLKMVKEALFPLILALAGSTLACALPNWATIVPDSTESILQPIEIETDQSRLSTTVAESNLSEDSDEIVLNGVTATPGSIQSSVRSPQFLDAVPNRGEFLATSGRNSFRLTSGLEYRVFPSTQSNFNFKISQNTEEGGIIRITPFAPNIEATFIDLSTGIPPEVDRYDRSESIIFVLESFSSEIEVNFNIPNQNIEPLTVASLPLERYVTIPIQEEGLFLETGAVDRFELPIEAEQLVVVEAVPESNFDVVLELYDAEGIRLSVDEESEGGAERLELSGLVPQQYTLVLIGFQASEGNYDLLVKVFDWDEN